MTKQCTHDWRYGVVTHPEVIRYRFCTICRKWELLK